MFTLGSLRTIDLAYFSESYAESWCSPSSRPLVRRSYRNHGYPGDSSHCVGGFIYELPHPVVLQYSEPNVATIVVHDVMVNPVGLSCCYEPFLFLGSS